MNRQTEAVARRFWNIVSSQYPNWNEVWAVLLANTDILKEILTWPQRPRKDQPIPGPLRSLLRLLIELQPIESAAKRAVYLLLADSDLSDPTSLADGPDGSSS